MVAYHEAGHAVVAYNLEHTDPVHKVTIVPRGRAGGATFTLPEDDRDEVSREWCLDSVTMAMGGRVSERTILGRLGSGAQSDILQATKMVRRMVTRWGMSDRLGPVALGETEEQIFLGKEWGHKRDFSEATAQIIDDEVTRIIKDCYDRAEHILTEHIDQLHLLAKTLLERETVDGEELRKLLSGEALGPVRSIHNDGTAPPRPEGTASAEAPAAAVEAGAPQPQPQERRNTAAASSSDAPPTRPKPASS